MRSLIFLILLSVTIHSSHAATIYVDAAATGANNGASWANAYTNLESAITAASASDELWVKAGIYKPLIGGRSATFNLKANVTLYGGFNGTETLVTQRNFWSNQTILSGDIGTVGVNTDNVYHVVTGVTSGTLDGFVITDGYGDGSGIDNKGGGILCNGTSPTITNCRLVLNFATYGGGLYTATGGSPTVSNTHFYNNSADYGGGSYHIGGGGIYNSCSYIGNKSNLSNAAGCGALSSATITMNNCIFLGNHGAGGTSRGGGFFIGSATGTLNNCLIYKNVALDGGGVYTGTTTGSLAINNTIIRENTATSNGNELNVNNGGGGDLIPTLTNCSILGGINGAGFFGPNSTDGGGNITDDPLFQLSVASPSTSASTFDSNELTSRIYDTSQSWTPGEHIGKYVNPDPSQFLYFKIIDNSATTLTVIGNTSFAAATTNYQMVQVRPSAGAGVIDAANGSLAPATDFDQNTRQDDVTADTGTGSPTFADIGPFEFAQSTIGFSTTSSATTNESTGSFHVQLVLNAPPGYNINQATSIVVGDNATGSATSGADYNPIGSFRVVFPYGTLNGATQHFSLGVIDDGTHEGNETVDLNLSGPVGPVVASGNTSHTITITDDDAAPTGPIYVSTSGNDANNGSSLSDAKLSLSAAITIASSGDTILVMPGTYSGALNKGLNFSGKDLTLCSTDGPDTTIIDCQNSGRAFTFNSSETPSAVIKGIKIINGNAANGGAILIDNNSSPTIQSCIFDNNNATSNGGALSCENNGSPQVRYCVFTNNSAAANGGAINATNSNGSFYNSIFSQNQAINGGVFATTSSATFINCLMYNNNATANGGAGDIGSGSTTTLLNCTLTKNSAATAGGAIFNNAGTPSISNSIIWGNTAPSNSSIFVSSGSVAVNHSCVEGGFAGTNNQNDDPQFTDPANNNFNLTDTSPCLDSSNASAPTRDLNGMLRSAGGTADLGVYEALHNAHHIVKGGVTVSDYVILCLSGEWTDQSPWSYLLDSMGTYDITQWRIFWYDGGDYLEGASIPGIDSLGSHQSKAYFMLTRNDAPLPLSTINHSKDLVIALHPGWNLIGNPFMDQRTSADIDIEGPTGVVEPLNSQTSNLVDTTIYEFNNGAYQSTNTLGPRQGCWVNNISGTTVNLHLRSPAN